VQRNNRAIKLEDSQEKSQALSRRRKTNLPRANNLLSKLPLQKVRPLPKEKPLQKGPLKSLQKGPLKSLQKASSPKRQLLLLVEKVSTSSGPQRS
jgi:hypothetical protein